MSAPRLTEKQKQAIVQAYVDGIKNEVIAAEFEVDPSYPAILAKRRGILVRRQAGRKGGR